MKKLLTLFILFLAAGTQLLYAQGRKVTGQVFDEGGVTVVGAGVFVKGNTSNGTVTDADGKFELSVADGDNAIIVQALGFEKQEVSIAGTNGVIVHLISTSKALKETIVTALGIKREAKTLAYATQTVNGEDMNKSGSGNAFSELDGKVSGLEVINASGDPGAGTYIRLRGVSSLTQDNQPLIVIDGIPIDNSINNYDASQGAIGGQAAGANGNLTGGSQPTNRGLDINPNDIESISVLKGPAASALYGIRAASGAIIITTKKGNGSGEKGVHVSVNTSYSVDQANKLPSMQNLFSEGSDGLYRDNYNNAATASTKNPKKFTWGASNDTLYRNGISNEYDPNGKVVGKSDPTGKMPLHTYDPYKFFQNGSTANNNVAISGGDEKNSYRMSLGNISQTGIIPKTRYNKTTVSMSGQSQVTDKLTITGSVNYAGSGNDKTQQGSNTSGIMLGLLRTPNTFDNSYGLSNAASSSDASAYLLPDGTQRNYRGGVGYDNPYWTVNRSPSHDDLNRVYGFAQANYKFNEWIDLTYRLGGDIYAQDSKQAFDIGSNGVASGAGEVNIIEYMNRQYNSDIMLNMHKKLSKNWNGSLLVGQNYYSQVSTNRFTQGTNLTLPYFLDMSNATSYLASEGEVKIRRSAWYMQAEADYKNMLFITMTGRDETSSTLPASNNNFFYPSLGASFIFTEALGLTGNNILSFGKLRASYAQVGKDAPAQALQTYYHSASIVDGMTNGLQWPLSGFSGYQISNSVATMGNPIIQPEKTNSYEVGTDLSFFHNKLSLNATYYYAKVDNAIITVPVPYSTGFAAAELNAATVTNKGLELTLSATPFRTSSGFRWDVSVNWSKNVNKVVKLSNGVTNLLVGGFTNGSIVDVPGMAAGQIYGTKFIHDPKTGQLLIDDVKTDANYGMPIVDPSAQNYVIGNTNPDWIGSLFNKFTYKSWSLAFQIAIRQGGQMWDGTRGAMDYFGTAGETANRNGTTLINGISGHLDSNNNIVSTGTKNTTKAPTNQYYWQNINNSFTGPTEATIEDASFVKLRQISLSYSLSKKLANKCHFQAVTFTVYADNIILWTKYKGVDPETSLAGPSNAQGLDYFNNPGIKSYGLRLNLGL